MVARTGSDDAGRMRLYWTHLWRSRDYRQASADERRLIEIRYCLARKLNDVRRRKRITQRQLAERLRIAQASVSRVERASNHVSLDIAVRCLIALGCTDQELAEAFDPSRRGDVRMLRRRAKERGFPAPRAPDTPPPAGEHRFLRKGSGPFIRLR